MKEKKHKTENPEDIYSRIKSAVLKEQDAEGELCVVEGLVISGNKLGREVGFCTANLELDSYEFLNKGAYIAKVEIAGVMFSGIFILETIHDKASVHLFDFSEDIYNETLSVSVVKLVNNELLQDLCLLSSHIRK
tara:strand:- start:16658 stop:17062 length:405 start_codon:yes stop_codon:yes gene_type:complete